MTHSNLRKAAVLIRSLDAETAATMLAQLTPDETARLQEAIRALGSVDPDEQADVAAEFRSVRPIASEPATVGVELQLSSAEPVTDGTARNQSRATPGKRFEFLEHASIDAFVPFLAREHAQTIAVVLSHLPPPRAAIVLAALPEKVQVDTLERLAALGETDPESVVVLERELAAWLARRTTGRPASARRSDAVASILEAADAQARNRIIANLRAHKAKLGTELAPPTSAPPQIRQTRPPKNSTDFAFHSTAARRLAAAVSYASVPRDRQENDRRRAARTPTAQPQPPLMLQFDDLIHLDNRALAAVVREVDRNLLLLALAGSKEEMIRRVSEQMPKRTARMLRRELRRMGPTRLSDVEAAQHALARVAAEQLNLLGGRSRCSADSPALQTMSWPESRAHAPVAVV
jgi:flagellar motor switch protein FliG